MYFKELSGPYIDKHSSLSCTGNQEIIMFIKPKGGAEVEKDKVKISTSAKNVGRVQSVARSVLGTFISATDTFFRMILIF